jgi:uncharacterized protein YqjF (DUF2071 family)
MELLSVLALRLEDVLFTHWTVDASTLAAPVRRPVGRVTPAGFASTGLREPKVETGGATSPRACPGR